MFEQTFALSDLPKGFLLVFLELALSVDNAIVLGMLSASLPNAIKKKVLYFGILSAFATRAIALTFIGYVIHYRFVQIVGSFYLLFLSGKFFWTQKEITPQTFQGKTLWKVIFLIELFDVIFAIDSILAGVAFISSSDPSTFASKIWIVYLGGMIGLIGVRYAGSCVGSIILKFPNMEKVAHLIIGLVGIKLLVEIFHQSSVFEFSFWGILFILVLFGFMRKK